MAFEASIDSRAALSTGNGCSKCGQHALRLPFAIKLPKEWVISTQQGCIYHKNLPMEMVVIIPQVILQHGTLNCTVNYTVSYTIRRSYLWKGWSACPEQRRQCRTCEPE